jgi:hypothetical protein
VKFILAFFILFSTLNADMTEKLFEFYQQGMYNRGCEAGEKYFQAHRTDETYVSLYAFSCLKDDQIDSLALPITLLNKTVEARSNAAYFTLLMMQKKLLIQSLYDNKPLYNLKFPTSSHLLSKIFDFYLKNPKAGEWTKEYQDPANSRQSYKLYTTLKNGRKTIAIDEYYDKILTLHHVY